jgi:hypothetical protein
MPYGLFGFIAVLLASVTLLDSNSAVEPRNEKFVETPKGFLYSNQFSPKFNLK